MGKELEALEKVYYGSQGYGDCDENYKIVKQALQRLESIDNANPSEALECLEKIIDNLDDYADFEIKQEANEYIDTIKQALLKVQKEHKALEIIKEKRIDIESFYTSFIEGDYDYSFYERRYGTYGKYCLTEEEFNTLKEVLE